MMKTIAIYNRKGGVGKTTCTLNLSHELVRRGLVVLLLDLDGQCDLTTQCQVQPGKPGGRPGNDILSVLKGQKKAGDVAVPVKGIPNLYLLPGHRKLEQFNFAYSQKVLLDRLQEPGLEEVDLVLVDFPSAESPAVTCGLIAADYVLLVTETERLSMDNVTHVLDYVTEVTALKQRVTKDQTTQVQTLAMLANKVDQRRNLTRKNLAELKSKYPDLLLENHLSINSGIVNSLEWQNSLRQLPYWPVTIRQFSEAATEILERLKQKGVTFIDETEIEEGIRE